jgi:hypothetical protein
MMTFTEDQRRAWELGSRRVVTKRQQDYGWWSRASVRDRSPNRMTSLVAAAAYGSNVHLSA